MAAEFETVSLKATPWKVAALAALKRESRLHLPDLQRGFVWSSERVRALHDSLYRRYPVGALLLWKPTWEGDESPFAIRAWDICPPHPSTSRGVREASASFAPGGLFVLDGQQRLTSLFRVIFRSRIQNRTTPDPDLLVALSPADEWVESPFALRSRSLVRRMREGLLIPAEALFEGIRGGNESLTIQKAIGEWVSPNEEMFFKALDRANAIRNAILQAEIIAYEIDADAEDENVIEIFARLNQQGVRLRPGDLAAARLTGEMSAFRERARLAVQSEQLARFATPEGREDTSRSGGLVDTDLLIRAALYLGSGLVRYRDVEKRKGQTRPYASVEQHWDRSVAGLMEAVGMYRKAGIPEGSWIPYRYLLLPPAIAAAQKHPLGDRWLGWAIVASIWGHYVGEVETKLQKDAGLASSGDVDGLIEHVKDRAKRIESAIPQEEDFTENIVGERGALLALLVYFARAEGRSFPGEKRINTADEPIEVHHIFPRAVLDRHGERDSAYLPDRLGNLTLLTRSDNEHLGDDEPSRYLALVSQEIRNAHQIPDDPGLWQVEKYPDFCNRREKMLAAVVRELLMNLGMQ